MGVCPAAVSSFRKNGILIGWKTSNAVELKPVGDSGLTCDRELDEITTETVKTVARGIEAPIHPSRQPPMRYSGATNTYVGFLPKVRICPINSGCLQEREGLGNTWPVLRIALHTLYLLLAVVISQGNLATI